MEPIVRSAQTVAGAALAQLSMIETLEHAYDAWLELKVAHAAFLARCAEERRKLEQQGAFLVGAVRAASQLEPGTADETGDASLTKDDGLDGFLREAEEKLAQTRASLEEELREEEAHYRDAFVRIRDEVISRVERLREGVRPSLRLRLRSLGTTRTVLHIDRLPPDHAVLLLHVLTARIPSRYGFLFDDSTEDVALAPPPFYPEEGVDASQVREGSERLRALLVDPERKVLPVKGHLPVQIPRAGGGEELFRLLQRGPVMEVEVEDGGAFRGVLSREEGERFAGFLLRLKLAGKIDLDVVAD